MNASIWYSSMPIKGNILTGNTLHIADKRQYAAYYRLVFDKVRPGGIIVADDVLWDGKVTEKDTRDAQTRGILEFNELVQADIRVENLLLPVRHGLMLIRKKD